MNKRSLQSAKLWIWRLRTSSPPARLQIFKSKALNLR